MKRFLQTLRFVAGLGLLVGGVAVLAPLAGDLLGSHGPLSNDAPVQSNPAQSQGAIGHAIPDPWAGGPLPPPTQPGAYEAEGGPPPVAAVVQAPSPPPSLPPQPAMMARPVPSLGVTYRSTLAIPPPPLLDAHGPPPLAPGWTNRDSRQPPRDRGSAVPAVPATYTVRDGDDLTSLAIRFYGHPATAAAILIANRDRLVAPDILPIGLELRLPPPWAVTAGRTAAEARSIEPGPGIERIPAHGPTGLPPKPTVAGQSWLDGALVPQPPAIISG